MKKYWINKDNGRSECSSLVEKERERVDKEVALYKKERELAIQKEFQEKELDRKKEILDLDLSIAILKANRDELNLENAKSNSIWAEQLKSQKELILQKDNEIKRLNEMILNLIQACKTAPTTCSSIMK